MAAGPDGLADLKCLVRSGTLMTSGTRLSQSNVGRESQMYMYLLYMRIIGK